MREVRKRSDQLGGFNPPHGLNLAIDAHPKLITHGLLGPLGNLLAHELLTFEDVSSLLAQLLRVILRPEDLAYLHTFLAARLGKPQRPFACLFLLVKLHDRVAAD